MVDSWGFLLLIVFALVWWIVFSMLDMFVLQLLQLLREVISVVARGCDPKAKMERHKHKPVRLLVSQVPREPPTGLFLRLLDVCGCDAFAA